MSKYDRPEMLCTAISAFITEIREQAAVIRACDNVFGDEMSNNVFVERAYNSIWRELISEMARIFDKAKTGSNDNCTLLRLKELCLEKQYSSLFPLGEKDILIQELDKVFEYYKQSAIGKSRNKQMAHHDMKQIFEGECIKISFEQLETLILHTTDVFSKIYTRVCYGIFEVSFIDYKLLVGRVEEDIRKLIK